MSELDNWNVYAEHANILCRIIPWEAVHGAGVMFSRDVTIHTPDAQIGRRDRVIMLEVVCCGPGNVSRGQMNPTTIRSGDIVLANLLHRHQDLLLFNDSLHTFPWENIMAKIVINDGDKTVSLEPLQAFLICKPNERIAQKLIMGDSKIIAPYGDSQLSGGVEPEPTLDAFGNQKKKPERNKTVIEEVVMVGPGAVVDGLWQEPPQDLVGGFVLYDSSVSAVRFMVGGQNFTLVHWRHVALSFRKPKAENAPAGATIQ